MPGQAEHPYACLRTVARDGEGSGCRRRNQPQRHGLARTVYDPLRCARYLGFGRVGAALGSNRHFDALLDETAGNGHRNRVADRQGKIRAPGVLPKRRLQAPRTLRNNVSGTGVRPIDKLTSLAIPFTGVTLRDLARHANLSLKQNP